jgi:hypothetical protein
MVTIIVGAEKKKFLLHKKLVCREAPYFDRIFNGNFEEAKTQDYCLREEEAFAFEVFVFYIYNGHFPQDVKAVTGISHVYEPIMKFYILADKLLMSKEVKTAALEAFAKARDSSGCRVNEAMIEVVFNRTANDCPMRKLVVDMLSKDFLDNLDCGRDWLVSCLKNASFEQIVELLMAIKSTASTLTLW